MASPIYSHYYSTDAHLPVRWMSPEILMVSFFFLFLFLNFYFFELEWWKWLFNKI
jgi:hypothetical protein